MSPTCSRRLLPKKYFKSLCCSNSWACPCWLEAGYLHLWPIPIISILGERLVPDKQNELVTVHRQTPKKLQVRQVMLRHGFIYPDIYLIEISVCFLIMENIMCGPPMLKEMLPITVGQFVLFEVKGWDSLPHCPPHHPNHTGSFSQIIIIIAPHQSKI